MWIICPQLIHLPICWKHYNPIEPLEVFVSALVVNTSPFSKHWPYIKPRTAFDARAYRPRRLLVPRPELLAMAVLEGRWRPVFIDQLLQLLEIVLGKPQLLQEAPDEVLGVVEACELLHRTRSLARYEAKPQLMFGTQRRVHDEGGHKYL